MAVIIVIPMFIGEKLLYCGCLHCTGSMCMFLLIHNDLRMSLIFQEILGIFVLIFISGNFTTLGTPFGEHTKLAEVEIAVVDSFNMNLRTIQTL